MMARAQRVGDTLARAFPDAEITTSTTTRPWDACDIVAERAEQWGQRGLICVAGGDGTVSEAINGAVNTSIHILVLPAGTGNDFARTLYGPHLPAVDDIVADLAAYPSKARVHAVDTVRVSSSTGIERSAVNTISVGFDSLVGITADRIHRRVPFLLGTSYLIAVAAELARGQRDFSCRGRWVDSAGHAHAATWRYFLTAVSNARYYGGGFQPNPHAIIDDGLIDITSVQPVGIGDMVRSFSAFRAGRAVDEHLVRSWRASTLTLEGDPELVLTIDGEGMRVPDVTLSVEPHSLRLLMPPRWAGCDALACRSAIEHPFG